MSNSKKEEILVVKTKKLFPKGIWEGFREIKQAAFLQKINKDKEYIRRDLAETDENYQQIIAQIILKVGNRIFIHRIPQTGSEKRLHNLWPIFLGGHIDKSDLNIEDAMEREFKEELNYKGKIISKKFWGVVKLHDNPVNKVHVGMVWIFEGDSEKFESTGDEGVLDGRFIDLKKLKPLIPKMSYWSKIVTPFLIKKYPVNITSHKNNELSSCVESDVFFTDKGTPYLKSPGLVMIAKPDVDITGVKYFTRGFPKDYEFGSYLKDKGKISSAEKVCKLAGQTCYMSFGPGRTWNKDAQRYFDNIITSGHGSVLEHASYSFLIWGISRSITHELVRHRAGCAYSQVSQRYVSGKVLRFVERPEYQSDKTLHHLFEERSDRAAAEYAQMADYLYKKQAEGVKILTGEVKTDLRKKVQQVSRSLLPNETEAPIMVTANVRAWRHMINMRASGHAEVEIRRVFYRIYQLLKKESPILFNDFKVTKFSDGTFGVETQFPKV
jgi:thymidylate synthase (FAD)